MSKAGALGPKNEVVIPAEIPAVADTQPVNTTKKIEADQQAPGQTDLARYFGADDLAVLNARQKALFGTLGATADSLHSFAARLYHGLVSDPKNALGKLDSQLSNALRELREGIHDAQKTGADAKPLIQSYRMLLDKLGGSGTLEPLHFLVFEADHHQPPLSQHLIASTPGLDVLARDSAAWTKAEPQLGSVVKHIGELLALGPEIQRLGGEGIDQTITKLAQDPGGPERAPKHPDREVRNEKRFERFNPIKKSAVILDGESRAETRQRLLDHADRAEVGIRLESDPLAPGTLWIELNGSEEQLRAFGLALSQDPDLKQKPVWSTSQNGKDWARIRMESAAAGYNKVQRELSFDTRLVGDEFTYRPRLGPALAFFDRLAEKHALVLDTIELGGALPNYVVKVEGAEHLVARFWKEVRDAEANDQIPRLS